VAGVDLLVVEMNSAIMFKRRKEVENIRTVTVSASTVSRESSLLF
jgi:hypothetical protein